MYDDVPSRCDLLPVQPHHFSHPPPDAIPHHRPAEGSLDAEAEAAFRQLVRFQENYKVRTRAALPGAIHGIELRFAYQTRAARILLPAGAGLPRLIPA
jgi:hypothetical protein